MNSGIATPPVISLHGIVHRMLSIINAESEYTNEYLYFKYSSNMKYDKIKGMNETPTRRKKRNEK